MLELAAKTLFVILSLLDYAGAPESVVEDNICQLSEVALGIATNAQSEGDLWDMLSVGYVESKFGYRGNYLVSGRGACGVFQQIPRYAYPSDFAKPTCDSLQSPDEAAFRVSVALRELSELHGEDRFCHYNAGNVCGRRAYVYQDAVLRTRRRVQRAFARLRSHHLAESAVQRFLRTRDWCDILQRPIY